MCCIQQGYGQKADTVDLISVSLGIVGQGTADYIKSAGSGYFALATLTNKQDTTIHFWIMSCSWPIENFVSSSDSINFAWAGCDHNTPDEIDLLPHRSIHFYGLIESKNKNLLLQTIKLGFIYFANFSDFWDSRHRRDKPKNLKIYWSNQAKIIYDLYSYQLD